MFSLLVATFSFSITIQVDTCNVTVTLGCNGSGQRIHIHATGDIVKVCVRGSFLDMFLRKGKKVYKWVYTERWSCPKVPFHYASKPFVACVFLLPSRLSEKPSQIDGAIISRGVKYNVIWNHIKLIRGSVRYVRKALTPGWSTMAMVWLLQISEEKEFRIALEASTFFKMSWSLLEEVK